MKKNLMFNLLFLLLGNAVLAQTIHTCTAKSFESRIQRILSSMSLRDHLENGESYYIVEIKALKRILDQIEKEDLPVLCIVDEVLRGTNTVERIAASTQILKSLTCVYSITSQKITCPHMNTL